MSGDGGLPPASASRHLPGWFVLLPLLAVAAWWPIEPYWQSDDFLALHYARDLPHALADFAGPQYGATDVWLFYRPLITLSFWLDQQIAGTAPFWSHLSNVLAHGLSALLVGLVWRRFLPDGRAFAAGMLWALLPGHLGALCWAVGRVDSHTTVWCLLAVWLWLRREDRLSVGLPAPPAPALGAVALALLSKESAFVLPPVLTALSIGTAPGAARERLRRGLRRSAPVWGLFAAYLAVRFAALGRFGGYLGAGYDPLAMLYGLGIYLRNELLPAFWAGHGGPGSDALLAVGGLALCWSLWWWSGHARRLLAALVVFAIAAAPMAAFLSGADNPHNLRYLYLPSVVLAGLVAGSGRLAAAALLLGWIPPLVGLRADQLAADRESRAMHGAVLRSSEEGAPSPQFVAGLPHQNRAGTTVQLHFGVDRMLAPPFADGTHRLFALRPLAESRGVFRLGAPNDAWALPEGSTWIVDGHGTITAAATPPPLPDLPIRGDEDGRVDLTSGRLLRLAMGELEIRLATDAGRPQAYRMTVLTANGYLCCLFLDHAEPAAASGLIDFYRLFGGQGLEKAVYGPSPSHNLGDALVVPTAIDLEPTFPVLLEAGSVDLETGRFTPTHRASRLLQFAFDRGYPAWVRTVQGR